MICDNHQADSVQYTRLHGLDAFYDPAQGFTGIDVTDYGGILGNTGELGGFGQVELGLGQLNYRIAGFLGSDAHLGNALSELIHFRPGITAGEGFKDCEKPADEFKSTDLGGERGEGFVQIPRYEVAASAGGGALIHSEQIVDHLTFKADWVRNTLGVPVSALALINVKGDSMEPTLSNGDVILIDMSKSGFDDNAVYVLRLNETLLVKRVKRNFDGSVLVSSDNVMYPPDVIKNDFVESLNVVGRVVWCGRRM